MTRPALDQIVILDDDRLGIEFESDRLAFLIVSCDPPVKVKIQVQGNPRPRPEMHQYFVFRFQRGGEPPIGQSLQIHLENEERQAKFGAKISYDAKNSHKVECTYENVAAVLQVIEMQFLKYAI